MPPRNNRNSDPGSHSSRLFPPNKNTARAFLPSSNKWRSLLLLREKRLRPTRTIQKNELNSSGTNGRSMLWLGFLCRQKCCCCSWYEHGLCLFFWPFWSSVISLFIISILVLILMIGVLWRGWMTIFACCFVLSHASSPGVGHIVDERRTKTVNRVAIYQTDYT